MSRRILVIDDEQGIRAALGQLLEYEGYEVHTIANGYRQVSSAINQGLPLMQIERKHGVIRSLTELGSAMMPAPGQPAGIFGRLFGRA